MVRQAGHHLARPARRGAQGAGRDQAHLLDLLFGALPGALDGARRRARAGGRDRPHGQYCRFGPHRLTNRRARPGSSSAKSTAASSPTSARTRCEQFLFFADANGAEVVSADGGEWLQPADAGAAGFRRDAGPRPGRHAATSGSTGSRRTASPVGRRPADRSSATRAISSCANTSTSTAPRHRPPVPGRPKGVQRIDCSDVELPYSRQLIRTSTPHRDRDAAGALLRRRRACAYRAGAGGAALTKRAGQSCAPRRKIS